MLFPFVDALPETTIMMFDAPGSNNTVPGQLELTIDIRHPEKASYDAMITGYQDCVQQACESRGTPVSMECFWEAHGVVFDADCVDAVRSAVNATGYESMEMVSGAGHDACKDGLSHNETESAEGNTLKRGATCYFTRY